MKRSSLDKALPEGMKNFNEWEKSIPKYQTDLMKKIDGLEIKKHPKNWTREALYEIVLWELNRFPEIGDELFHELKKLADVAPGKHRQGKDIFCKLLNCKNVGLTMATAIMRFVNPDTFQTLNARNGYVVNGKEAPAEPNKLNQKYLDEISEYYFEYLDKLHELTGNGFDFRIADRMLYQIDKASGRKLEN